MNTTADARKALLEKISVIHSPLMSRVAAYVNHEAEFDCNGTPCNEAAELMLDIEEAVAAANSVSNMLTTKETGR